MILRCLSIVLGIATLMLYAPAAFSVSIDITSGTFSAGPGGDFNAFYNIHGPDFSMRHTSPTASGLFEPTDGHWQAARPGTMVSLGGSATMYPFNTITYGGQTYPYASGNFSFTTPLVPFPVVHFPEVQNWQTLTSPFTFSGQAFALNGNPSSPGYVPAAGLPTFDLRGEGIATISFHCGGTTTCWSYGGSYQFQAAAEPPPPPPAQGPAAPAPAAPGVAPTPSSPSTASPPATQSASQRRVPAQPIQVTGLLDLRQQLIQLKQEWGVSTGTGSALGTMSAMGGSGRTPVVNPEPTSVVLLASGLTGLGIRRFIRTRKVW